ncbi:MAG: ABC transporter substrate-binding protein [Myxococcales bacterium]|nr:ABC transporter substrate-binding protein [Myxococcales bacterium]
MRAIFRQSTALCSKAIAGAPRRLSGRCQRLCFLLALHALAGCTSVEPATEEVVIGVMLQPVVSADPIRWGVEHINAAGGIDGRPLSLRVEEIGQDPDLEVIRTAAETLIADPDVVAVIGPASSQEVVDVAPVFSRNKLVMVSPSSTSEEVFRAWHGEQGKYVWRTTVADTAQIQAFFRYAKQQGKERVATITAGCTPEDAAARITSCQNAYGQTFFDWFGFLASEAGLSPTAVERYNQAAELSDYRDTGEATGCEESVQRVLDSEPDIVFGVVSPSSAAICLVKTMAREAPEVELFLSDGGLHGRLIEDLEDDAEGVHGFALVGGDETGFEEAFAQAHPEADLPNYGANSYDALLLLAYGLQITGGIGGERLADALHEVVDGRASPTTTSWQPEAVAPTLAAFARGERPDIAGATGTMTYDEEGYTDLLEGTYSIWRIEGSDIVHSERFSTEDTRAALFVEKEAPDALLGQADDEVAAPPAENAHAIVVAASTGWENYRHQADALAQYRLLQERGFDDDHILFVSQDDIATHASNPAPGSMFHEIGGPDLHDDPVIDLRVYETSLDQLQDSLEGLDSSDTDNVYMYLVGHGDEQGVLLFADSDGAQGDPSERLITPAWLADRIESMRFRRMLVMVEACFSGVFGQEIERRQLEGVFVLTAASPTENSLAINYDPDLDAWLADSFSAHLAQHLLAPGDATLSDLYVELYRLVAGSHVHAYNQNAFGGIRQALVSEFVTGL